MMTRPTVQIGVIDGYLVVLTDPPLPAAVHERLKQELEPLIGTTTRRAITEVIERVLGDTCDPSDSGH